MLHYFVANAWANLRTLAKPNVNKTLDWEQTEAENEIIHRRMALNENALSQLPDEQACQFLINMGNLMDYVGRFVEAIEYWDRALAKSPSFPMARGNRGCGLSNYACSLYDKGHAAVFLIHAYADLKIAPTLTLHEDAKKIFEERRKRIVSALLPEYLNKKIEMLAFPLGTSEEEIRYRQWCLENRLFLNPLNDLGPYPIAAQDILTAPNIVTGIGEGPYYFGYFNQMKQEFVSARYLYYEGITAKKPHFSDSQVLLYNTLDYPAYSLANEKVKIAFRMAYSLFDKIGYFLNHYLNLSISEKEVTFRMFWYESRRKKNGLRKDIQQLHNLPLRGLFWLSKDLYETEANFKEAIEPDAQELAEIRHHLEHKYLKVHDILRPRSSSNEASLVLTDTLAFSIYRREFEVKTLKLLKMTRAALIYLSLAIHWEEQRRAKERDSKTVVPEMPLDIWEDKWKV